MTATEIETAAYRADDAPRETSDKPLPELNSGQAALIVQWWTLAMCLVTVFLHPTALYFVETDLIGEYLPAAREWLTGSITTSHYAFKGPGYPALLAAFAGAFHLDLALAAKTLSALSMGAVAWFAFSLVRLAAGGFVASFTLVAMLANPSIVRYAIEAGTDAPALALMLFSTWCVMREGRPAWRLLAGLLAGYAALTRGNAIFLLPCAALVVAGRPRRVANLAAYACGILAPLAGWALVAGALGGAPDDRNYLNVAWGLYGEGVPWNRFETTIGSRFHSLWDVVSYDPLRLVSVLGRNLAIHRLLDLRDLVTPWIGVLALPGLWLLVRRPRSSAWLIHALACAVVLAAVFYNARFALYLLPFYLAAAGATWEWLARAAWRFEAGLGERPSVSVLVRVACLISLGASAAVAGIQTGQRLADAPHEARWAGEKLQAIAPTRGRILARKPHVAYYAGMQFVSLPTDLPMWRLAAWGRQAGADYLYFSGLEQLALPNDGVLADSAAALPGFRQVFWRRTGNGHFCAVYRLEPWTGDSTAFAAAYETAIRQYEARHAGDATASLFVALQYLDLRMSQEALLRLDRLERMGARDPVVERARSSALLALGDLNGADEACRAAMSLERPTAWHWSRLGEIRARQGQFMEARRSFSRAVEIEPASLSYLELLGRTDVALRDFRAAGITFDRCVRLAPRDPRLRRMAMGAWQLAGDTTRFDEVYREGLRNGLSSEVLLGAVVEEPVPGSGPER